MIPECRTLPALCHYSILTGSLVVQWLGLHASTAGARVSSLLGKLRFHTLLHGLGKERMLCPQSAGGEPEAPKTFIQGNAAGQEAVV